MDNVSNYKKFCLQPYNSREMISIIKGCNELNLNYTFSKDYIKRYIPMGSIEYSENCKVLNRPYDKIINFYPSEFSDLISRTIGCLTFPDDSYRLTYSSELFIKDACSWKNDKFSKLFKAEEFNNFCSLDTRLYVSTPVKFIKEWRYYISEGIVLDSGIYSGEEINEKYIQGPSFPIKIPKNFYGAIDLGLLENGNLELVECHAPFACGFYGEDYQAYTYWMYTCWQNIEQWISFFYIN